VRLATSKVGSPLPSMSASPMHKLAPTSQPSSTNEAVIAALRVPVIHLLAREPASEASLAKMCRTSSATMKELLPKIAKRSTQDSDKWQLTDKSFREINPYSFPYSTQEEREQAIEGAIKSFDRMRLTKEDKLWQVLLPREQRGQGICLSRSKVKALETKPKASTPLHKMSDFTKKKPVAKKAEDKPAEKRIDGDKKTKPVKEKELKPPKEGAASKLSKAAKDKLLGAQTAKEVKDEAAKATTPNPATASTLDNKAASRPIPSTEANKIRTKKVPASQVNSSSSTPRSKPKMAVSRESYQHRPVKPVYNTKPKNPSPLSASPPVNASDFEDSHPVHKALAAAASPVKSSYGNSDRSLKRKANDIDSDIHNHSLAVKKPNADRATPSHTPSHTNGRPNGSTPSSSGSVKRKSDDSSTSNTPTTAPKVRKVTSINVGLASRYNNSHPSPGDSSSSTTSPTIPSLSFRQTVELSQKFQKYYTKYEELYWRLTEATSPPTEAQRNDLLKMHKKLEEMKREIKAGARVQR
jgi:RNA polymerase II elongation factor ELL